MMTKEEQKKDLDERLSRLARDVASCMLINAGFFRALIPGDRRDPAFVGGEFTIDLFEEHTLVAQVIVRDVRVVPPSTSSTDSRVKSRSII